MSYKDLCSLFDGEFRRKPDILEPYAIRLEGVEDQAERQEIMRCALRETIDRRWPMTEVKRIT